MLQIIYFEKQKEHTQTNAMTIQQAQHPGCQNHLHLTSA
jgi:hypothetical protein